MTLDTQAFAVATPTYENEGWVADLAVDGSARELAQRRLHRLLVGAARRQVWRLRDLLPGAGPGELEDLAQQAADEALVIVLRKLATFRAEASSPPGPSSSASTRPASRSAAKRGAAARSPFPTNSLPSTEHPRRPTWRRPLTSPAPSRTPSPPASARTNAGSSLRCWSMTYLRRTGRTARLNPQRPVQDPARRPRTPAPVAGDPGLPRRSRRRKVQVIMSAPRGR